MLNRHKTNRIFSIGVTQLKYLNVFWISFTIFSLFSILAAWSSINQKILNYSCLAAAVTTLFSGIYLIRPTLKSSYLKLFFYILFVWLLITIFRGIQFNHHYLIPMIDDPYLGILPYLVPAVILFPINLNFFNKLFEIILIQGTLFLILDFAFVKDIISRTFETQNSIEYFSSFSIPCGFILLTYKYHSKKQNIFALGVLLLSTLLSIYKARRGLSFISLTILISSGFIFFRYTSKKGIALYFFALTVLTISLYFSQMYQIKKNSLFGLIAERGEEDTRTLVETYFYDDMKHTDWITGKGINGEYFCPDVDPNQVTNYRSYIETGYLNMILKGGLIFLILYLVILIPACILGFFFSKNMLSKAAAIWILISIISLYPQSITNFDMNYFLIWISVGICYSKELRRIPDYVLTEFFKSFYQISGNQRSNQ